MSSGCSSKTELFGNTHGKQYGTTLSNLRLEWEKIFYTILNHVKMPLKIDKHAAPELSSVLYG